MPPWLLDLIAWTIAFIVLFLIFRRLQNKKTDKKD